MNLDMDIPMNMSARIEELLDVLAWGVMDACERLPTRPLRFLGIFVGMFAFALTFPLQLPLFVAHMLAEMWESTEHSHK